METDFTDDLMDEVRRGVYHGIDKVIGARKVPVSPKKNEFGHYPNFGARHEAGDSAGDAMQNYMHEVDIGG